MNNLVIVGIIVGLLIVGGIAFVSAISSPSDSADLTTETCTSCGGRCTAEDNCGLATCGAVNGGTCNCGR